MSLYQIVGADGRQYGPVSAEQLRQWIAEGRANAQTQAFGEGSAEWKPLGALPEFAGLFAPPVPLTIRPPVSGPVRKTNAYAMAGLIFGVLAFFAAANFSLVCWALFSRSSVFRRSTGILNFTKAAAWPSFGWWFPF